MLKPWINIVVKRKSDPDGGGLLEQVQPPYPVEDLQPPAIINVKGKNYRVIGVVGDLKNGPAEIQITDE